MPACISCGKKGIFLQLNSSGRCKRCETAYQEKIQFDQAEWKRLEKEEHERLERERQQSEIANAQKIYTFVSDSFRVIKEDIFLDGSKDLTVVLLDIKSKISLCDSLLDTLDSYTDYPALAEIILQNLSVSSNISSLRKLNDWDASIWDSDSNIVEKAVSDIRKNILRHKSDWNNSRKSIENNFQFESVLHSLPVCSFSLANDPIAKLHVSDLSTLTYTRITSRTNYDKLGTFVVIDTETTGLNCSCNEIIELSGIRFENWDPVEVFTSLIKPKKEIPAEITRINGITNTMVENAPSIGQVVPAFTEFCSGYNLVGHNLEFDLKFLYKNGVDFLKSSRKYYDTLQIAQSVLKKPKYKYSREYGSYEIDYDVDYDVIDHKLVTLCDYYYIRNNLSAHRSSSDCLATGYLFKHLSLAKIH